MIFSEFPVFLNRFFFSKILESIIRSALFPVTKRAVYFYSKKSPDGLLPAGSYIGCPSGQPFVVTGKKKGARTPGPLSIPSKHIIALPSYTNPAHNVKTVSLIAIVWYFQQIQQPYKCVLPIQACIRKPAFFFSPFREPSVIEILFCIFYDKRDHIMS